MASYAVIASGGARATAISGTATYVRPNISASLIAPKASLTVERQFVFGRLKRISAEISTLGGGTGGIDAALPAITSSIEVADRATATVTVALPTISAVLVGGVHDIDTALPTITSVIDARAGSDSSISVELPVLAAIIVGVHGIIGTVDAPMPLSTADAAGVTGVTASVNASLTRQTTYVDSYVGAAGGVTGALPTLTSAIDAGFGAAGTISAKLPRVAARFDMLVRLLAQQAVLVVNTHTNALSTYEQYPFNSFCELGGVYYGAGPSGLCRLDVGDTDAGAPISAGLSTGLLNFKEPHQKRMTDAYMTLRTTGDLTFTTTVDEAATYPTVVLTLPVQPRTEFVQRRVVIPKGLRGKSWRFELNNVSGADFDFGHLGLNVAPCARRI